MQICGQNQCTTEVRVWPEPEIFCAFANCKQNTGIKLENITATRAVSIIYMWDWNLEKPMLGDNMEMFVHWNSEMYCTENNATLDIQISHLQKKYCTPFGFASFARCSGPTKCQLLLASSAGFRFLIQSPNNPSISFASRVWHPRLASDSFFVFFLFLFSLL